MTTIRRWVAVLRWGRVALATATLLLAVALLQADHKVALLERQEPVSAAERADNQARISALEQRVTTLEAATTTTATTTSSSTTLPPARGPRPRRRTPTTTGTTRRSSTTTGHAGTTGPPSCDLIVPISHQCINGP